MEEVFEKTVDLIRKSPDLAELFREIVDFEEKHKDQPYFSDVGWEWSDLRVEPVLLKKLYLMGILNMPYKGKRKGYLLADREAVKRALEYAEAEQEELKPEEKPVEPTVEIFSDIIGYEDVKKLFIKGLKKRVHFLMVGPPASASRDTRVIVRDNHAVEAVPLDLLYKRWLEGWKPEALSVNRKTLKTEWKPILAVMNHGYREVVKIKLRGGREVVVTKDHSLFTLKDGELVPITCEDLKRGDSIPVVYKTSYGDVASNVNGVKLDEKLGFSTGIWLADGTLYEDKDHCICELTNFDDDVLNMFAEGLKSIDAEYKPLTRKHRKHAKRTYRRKIFNYFRQFVADKYAEEKGKGRSSRNKWLPPWVFLTPKEFKRGLINGFFRGDARREAPYFTISSRRLRDDMMMLLMEFGVPTTIKEVVGRGKYAGRKYYVLRVPESFRDKVGYSGDYGKHDEIVRVPVPEYHVRRSTLGISCAKRLLEHLSKIVHSDLFWDIIEKIEEAGTEEVYDLSVKDNENFVTDQGILLHNSAKSLFLLCIESIPGAKYVIGSRASKAGISDYLINYKPRILLIDEFDKMHIQDIAVLLSMMETGRVSEMLYGKTREVELDTVVFAAANTMKGLPPEAKSRFQILHFTEYSEDEFKQVVVNVLKRRGVDEDLAQYIAQSVWSTLGSKDPREAIRIAKLASTKEEVDEVIDVLKRRR